MNLVEDALNQTAPDMDADDETLSKWFSVVTQALQILEVMFGHQSDQMECLELLRAIARVQETSDELRIDVDENEPTFMQTIDGLRTSRDPEVGHLARLIFARLCEATMKDDVREVRRDVTAWRLESRTTRTHWRQGVVFDSGSSSSGLSDEYRS